MVCIANNVEFAILLIFVMVTTGLFGGLVYVLNPLSAVSSMCGWSRGPGGLA